MDILLLVKPLGILGAAHLFKLPALYCFGKSPLVLKGVPEVINGLILIGEVVIFYHNHLGGWSVVRVEHDIQG